MREILSLVLVIFLFTPNFAKGLLKGKVLDFESKLPVEDVQIFLKEKNFAVISDKEGIFVFENLRSQNYTLKFYRIGYEEKEFQIDFNDSTNLKILLTPTVTKVEEVFISAEENELSVTKSAIEVSGSQLRQNLGSTIAETVTSEPGIEMRSMGPAPARPVLRGLSGDRLLLLEDGGRTGDLSATSADHAVAVEPINAQKIEVIRGAKAILFGSNTLGGVINVVSEKIPIQRVDEFHAVSSLQAESVNSGFVGSLNLLFPLQDFAVRFDGSLRNAQDVSTPIGKLKNTNIETENTNLGISWFQSKNIFGASGGFYKSDYGIPGGFIGAHPNGVGIKVERKHFETKTDFKPNFEFAKNIELKYNFSDYKHEEIEGDGLVGISFSVFTYNLSGKIHLKENEILRNGTLGFWSEIRDYSSGGLSSTPETIEKTFAGFVHQNAIFGKVTLGGSTRFDFRQVNPSSQVEAKNVGEIRNRNFGGFSGAFEGTYKFDSGISSGVILTKTFRAPTLEELFSEGPHLAAYSFEVGNSDLKTENGFGSETFLKFENERGFLEATVFRNEISNFTFAKATGDTSWRTLLPIYQYTGLKALMQGFEFGFDWQILPRIFADGSLSFVKGNLTDLDEAIPEMPPLSGKLNLRYKKDLFAFGGGVKFADKQDRLGEFEQKTKGFLVYNLFGSYVFKFRNLAHSLDFGIENLTNETYRKHLSKVKSVMPESGRNFKVLYKVYF
ncbi:MAG: TonB-dependent receptor [Calditrichaeota bacterium]|nr:MAG: TonB-dependent receptor [Calditrichota bacterium]